MAVAVARAPDGVAGALDAVARARDAVARTAQGVAKMFNQAERTGTAGGNEEKGKQGNGGENGGGGREKYFEILIKHPSTHDDWYGITQPARSFTWNQEARSEKSEARSLISRAPTDARVVHPARFSLLASYFLLLASCF
jgi:hypothetical protein